MSVCRLCKKWDEPLFKYGTRRYAHADCALQKWGAKFLDMIPAHQIGRLPYRALRGAGVEALAMRLWEEHKEASR